MEKVPLKQLLFLVSANPVNGITWVVINQKSWDYLMHLGPWFLSLSVAVLKDLEFCLCLLRMIAQVLWYYFETVVKKGKTSCSTLIVTLELDPYLRCFLPHPPFSCCSLFVVSRWRAGSHLIGWPSWMEWDRRKQRPSCYDIFLCSLCMPLELVEKLLKGIARLDPYLRLSEFFSYEYFFIEVKYT